MRRVQLEMRSQDIPAEVCAVELDGAEGEQQSKKVPVIPAADAVVDPRAMMITHRYADTTEVTVLRSRRLEQFTGAAHVARAEQDMIVRVVMKSVPVTLRGDVVTFVDYA